MKKILSILAAVLLTSGVYALEKTVANGTKTNSNVPVYGSYADCAQRSQLIYPSSLIAALNGYQIKALAFYIKDYIPNKSWTGYSVLLAEVSATDFASQEWNTEKEPELVFTGNLNGTSGKLLIEFDKPFDYHGGNLLIEFRHDKLGAYSRADFLGESQNTYTGISKHSEDAASWTELSSPAGRYFMPKLTLTYAKAAACPKPLALKLKATSVSSASFAWNAGGSETQWQYTVAKGNATPDWNAAQSVSSSSLTVSGLDAQTDYTLYLRAFCSEDSQSEAASIAFTTDCTPVASLPWTEGFESFADHSTMPACWKAISNNDIEVFSYAGLAHTGNNYLSVKGGAPSTIQVVMLPQFAEPVKNLTLSFYYTASFFAYGKYGFLSVGYLTDDADEETFVQLDAFPRMDEYDFAEVDFKDASDDAKRIALVLAGGEEDAAMLFDDLKVVSSNPQALTDVPVKSSAVKRIENGQLVIIKNGVKINAIGSIVK